MGKKSRDKGKVGEREFAALLRGLGFAARRGVQYHGLDGRDVVTNIDGIHFEVKRVETLRLTASMEQACDDAKAGEIPVIAHRKSHQPWLLTLRAVDVLQLVEAVLNAKREN